MKMVKKVRKRYDAAFKEKVVLEAMKEQKTLSQIASDYGIHPNQVSQWKQQVVSGLRDLLLGKVAKAETDEESLTSPLYEQIGRLQVENAYLKKKLKTLPKAGL
jgi:transposase-like protein